MDHIMNSIFVWCSAHQAVTVIISVLIGTGLAALPNTIFQKAGFTFSQFVRKILGKNVEKELENKIGAFKDGMNSD